VPRGRSATKADTSGPAIRVPRGSFVSRSTAEAYRVRVAEFKLSADQRRSAKVKPELDWVHLPTHSLDYEREGNPELVALVQCRAFESRLGSYLPNLAPYFPYLPELAPLRPLRSPTLRLCAPQVSQLRPRSLTCDAGIRGLPLESQ